MHYRTVPSSSLLFALSLTLVAGACGEGEPADESIASAEQPLSSTRKPFDPGTAPPLKLAPSTQEDKAIDLRALSSTSDIQIQAAFSYSASNTNSATVNTADAYFSLSAGQTITLGTCGLPGASGSGDTYLRFYNPSGVQVAYNDDSCGLLSNFSYTIPTSGTYRVSAGCFSSSSCSGTVAYTVASNSGTWTSWLNRDDPSGQGDYETLADFPPSSVCNGATPIGIECQTLSGVDWRSTGEVYTCSPTVGGYCVNSNQPDGICLDYRVRFLCP